MSGNSRNCKTWAVAFTIGMMLLAAILGTPGSILTAPLPLLVTMLLDAYYLALERSFRDEYNRFVRDLHQEKLTGESLLYPNASRNMVRKTLGSLRSYGVYGFHPPLAITLAAIWATLP